MILIGYLFTSFQEEMFVDVGVYGVPKNDRFDAERTTRKVEEFVRSGKPSMIHSSTTLRNHLIVHFFIQRQPWTGT